MANGDYYESGTIMSYKNDPVLGKVAHENSTGVLEKGPKRKLTISRWSVTDASEAHNLVLYYCLTRKDAVSKDVQNIKLVAKFEKLQPK